MAMAVTCNYKGALNELLVKGTKGAATKEDVRYQCSLVSIASGQPLYEATVFLRALGQAIKGQPRERRRAAEQSAALAALSSGLLDLPAEGQASSRKASPLASPAPKLPSEAALPSAPAPALVICNYKGQLQELLARAFLGQPCKVDYDGRTLPSVESHIRHGGRYQSTLRVTPPDSEPQLFVGGITTRLKQAEQSAAAAALAHFSALVERSLHTLDLPLRPAPAAATTATDGNYKSLLNEFAMKAAWRQEAAHISYSTESVEPSGFRSTLTYKAIRSPAELTKSPAGVEQKLVFQGLDRGRKKDAEQSAAEAAMRHLLSPVEPPRPTKLPEQTSLPTPVASPPVPDEAGAGNAKSQLNELVMKMTSRPLAREHIVYKVTPTLDGHFQAVCCIPALDGVEAQGDICQKKRDAEQSAAERMLLALEGSKVHRTQANPGLQGPLDAANPILEQPIKDFKSLLNELVMKVTGSPVTKNDILYHVDEVDGQFLASVRVECLESKPEFRGEPAGRKKEAEQFAAYAALNEFSKRDIFAECGAHKDAERQKRRLAVLHSDLNFKSAFNEIATRIIGRPLTSQDCLYATERSEPAERGLFVSTLNFTAISTEPLQTFQGEPRSRKNAAEQMAAKNALEYFTQMNPALARNPAPLRPSVLPAMLQYGRPQFLGLPENALANPAGGAVQCQIPG